VLWYEITDLGDSGVTVPACLAIALWLTASRSWRDAIRWLLLFGAAAALVVATKIAFIGWDVGIPEADFTGVSGHAMSSTSVLAVTGLYLGARASRADALLGAGVGYGLGILIAVSRIVVGVHSVSEVFAGCVLGAVVSVAMVNTAFARPMAPIASTLLALTLLVIVMMRDGDKAPSEQWITRIALQLSGHSTPYVRYKYRVPSGVDSHIAVALPLTQRPPLRDPRTGGDPLVPDLFSLPLQFVGRGTLFRALTSSFSRLPGRA
jgi:PAP2 superfamily